MSNSDEAQENHAEVKFQQNNSTIQDEHQQTTRPKAEALN